jgi:hypothetical protein
MLISIPAFVNSAPALNRPPKEWSSSKVSLVFLEED